ncbi:hypothetical protein LX36DRAFT_707943 [Colletotrichum falcatum]|nr:hypothetical protein LX36DRAFT_707943 [Colletotrichum falcatum]
MGVQFKNEESETPVKIEEDDVPVNMGERHVQVRAEDKVSIPPLRPSSQLRCVPSGGASRISTQPARSSSSLLVQQTSAYPVKLAVHNDLSAIAPSAAPANLMSRHGPAPTPLPISSSASISDTANNAPLPKGSGVRRFTPSAALANLISRHGPAPPPAPIPSSASRSGTTTNVPTLRVSGAQFASTKLHSVTELQPAPCSGPKPTLDAAVVPLPTPPPQPEKHMQGKRRLVRPMKTAKPMAGTVHPEIAVPFYKETRAWLDDKPDEDWTYTTSTGSIEKLPQLGSRGPWRVSLPSKIDTAIHIDPYIDRLSHLLNVQIESTRSPPSIHIKLFESQLAEQAKHSYLLEEHTAMKWKAWAVLAAWVDHLIRRGAPPAIPPIDLVSFVRNKLLAEGRHAKETAIGLLNERKGVILLPEGHGTLQMPRPIPADLVPLPKPSPPGSQQPSLTPTKRLLQPAKYGQKYLLTDDSSSSSDSDSSPEFQAKRLRHKS